MSTDRGLIILDRDGVINHDADDFIKTPDEWRPIPGSIDAIARLSQAGYTITVASNQSGIGRGLFDLDALEMMHAKLRFLVEERGGRVDLVVVCPHHPDDGCDCRKPKPGLFLQIRDHFGTSLDGVVAIGDNLRDLQAARAAGATPVLVRTGKGLRTEAQLDGALADVAVYDSLADAVDALLAKSA
ncbi:MAG: D-glycero-beta-D-manno-heptose 1,7-bisphosphate 7-phosphatase [Woeseiaceae bacterium]|nr:D-glycero-beta-D-manno-heptose 1,7-bisphosphate 7-phosphatase [Woeseiaceae bacterium]